MGDMQGRQVVITGGTGSLGSAVVGRFLERGATCIISCLKEEELKRFPFIASDRVHLIKGIDLADESSVQRLYAQAGAHSGGRGLWASVHVAGGFAYAPIASMTHADYAAQIRTNLDTCFLCCREAVKSIRAAGTTGGRIVNVAARPALEPRLGANMTAYTAAKCAVAGLTQALAEEVAGEGILVNAVLPSIMDTPANRASMPTADHSKWANVQDVAATIVFLASPENTCTRGGLVPVYGAA
ncbi:MAG: SDR family NAD(P)-dependent oxidoreductase [Phycisphaerales bacterium]|nr:SDR family NAD(P)-dependent oxidoreductase [Phycisphaerales bacterium]